MYIRTLQEVYILLCGDFYIFLPFYFPKPTPMSHWRQKPALPKKRFNPLEDVNRSRLSENEQRRLEEKKAKSMNSYS